jgi:hypothetical protein
VHQRFDEFAVRLLPLGHDVLNGSVLVRLLQTVAAAAAAAAAVDTIVLRALRHWTLLSDGVSGVLL